MKDITSWATGLSEAASAPAEPATSAGPFLSARQAALSPSSDDAQYLQALAAEALGWHPLGDQAYLHVGAPEAVEVVHVVGVADTAMANQNVVLLNY